MSFTVPEKISGLHWCGYRTCPGQEKEQEEEEEEDEMQLGQGSRLDPAAIEAKMKEVKEELSTWKSLYAVKIQLADINGRFAEGFDTKEEYEQKIAALTETRLKLEASLDSFRVTKMEREIDALKEILKMSEAGPSPVIFRS
jgi:hypothetical protein